MPRLFNNSASNFFDAGDLTQFPNPYITISCWVRFTTVAAQQALVTKWSTTSATQEWLLEVSNTLKLQFATTNGGGAYTIVTGATTLVPGQWYHLLGQQSPDGARVWINGKMDAFLNTTKNWPNTATTVRLGLHTGGAALPLNGAMRDVAVWFDYLQPVEIWRLSQGTLPMFIRPNRIGAWWPLEEGGNARDRSVFNSTATQNGSVPPVMNQDPATVSEHIIAMFAAEGLGELDISVPRLKIGTHMYEPELEGPEQIFPPFATIGFEPFTPGTSGVIEPPFYTVGFQTKPVNLIEGSPPPFIPPSLPPTLGGGAGPGGGGAPIPPVGPGVPLPPLSSGGLAGIRFYQGPPWRWVVTDLESNTLTFLDRLTFEADIQYTLNRAATAKLNAPSDNPEVNILDVDGFPFVNEGDRLLYGFRREGGTGEAGKLWVCRYAGTILNTEDTGLTEDARTILTATDPWQRLYQRPMVDIDGEFPDEAGFFSFDDTQVGVIALTFLRNTIINHGDVGIDMGDQDFATVDDMPGTPIWGSAFGYAWGDRSNSEYETTTQVDMSFQQGLSVGEVWDQLVQTGLLDIVLTPVYDPINRPGITHEVSIYDRVGTLAADAVMAWDKPSRNLVKFSHVKDGYRRANTVRFYEHQGGPPVGGGIPVSYGPSILRYGEYWAQQFFPGRVEEAVLAFADLQLTLRANGIDTVQIEPTSERAPFTFMEYFLGDTVPVYASNKVREAVAGFQRVYGINVVLDENSYETLPRILGSPEAA